MGEIINSRSTLGRVTEYQKTLTLPGESDTPAEIDLNENPLSIQIFIKFKDDIYITLAEDAASGASRIASNSSRTLLEEGHAEIPIVGQKNKLYIKKVSGAAVAEGLTYWFTEAD